MALHFDPENTKLLLVGTTEYVSPNLAPITPAVGNIYELRKLFLNKNIIGLPNRNIKTLINSNLEELLKVLRRFKSDPNIETFIFYFVGHGHVMWKNGKEHWFIMVKDSIVDANDFDYVKRHSLEYNDFKSYIENIGQNRIVILDACYSGQATQSYNIFNCNIKGTFTISSSSANEESLFDPSDDYTYFTKELISIFRNGIENNKQFLSINDIYEELYIKIEGNPHLPNPTQKNNFIKAFNFAKNQAYIKREQNKPTNGNNAYKLSKANKISLGNLIIILLEGFTIFEISALIDDKFKGYYKSKYYLEINPETILIDSIVSSFVIYCKKENKLEELILVLEKVIPDLIKKLPNISLEQNNFQDLPNFEELNLKYAQFIDEKENYFLNRVNNQVNMMLTEKNGKTLKRIVFTEGTNINIIKAAHLLISNYYIKPILLGNKKIIKKIATKNDIDIDDIEIIDHESISEDGTRKEYARLLYMRTHRNGITLKGAYEKMFDNNHFAAMMVAIGFADTMISKIKTHYSDILSPSLQIIRKDYNIQNIVGLYMVTTENGSLHFFSNTITNSSSTANQIVQTTLLTANAVKQFNIQPIIALVSYSNFGNIHVNSPRIMKEATHILHREYPVLIVDGEVQMNLAINSKMRDEKFPFSIICCHKVNTFIFPNLSIGNLAYQIMQQSNIVDVIGPIFLGLNKPVYAYQEGSEVNDVVTLAKIAGSDSENFKLYDNI